MGIEGNEEADRLAKQAASPTAAPCSWTGSLALSQRHSYIDQTAEARLKWWRSGRRSATSTTSYLESLEPTQFYIQFYNYTVSCRLRTPTYTDSISLSPSSPSSPRHLGRFSAPARFPENALPGSQPGATKLPAGNHPTHPRLPRPGLGPGYCREPYGTVPATAGAGNIVPNNRQEVPLLQQEQDQVQPYSPLEDTSVEDTSLSTVLESTYIPLRRMGSYGEPLLEEMHSPPWDPKSPPKPWTETPLIESEPLSRLAGCAMGNLILHHLSRPANHNKNLHFFIPSGGNAGIAAVTAARALGYPCTVVVPTYTSPMMLQRLQAAGAITVPHGANIDVAAAHMRDVLMAQMQGAVGPDGRELVAVELHPFDHEAIWEGVSSMVDELAAQLPPDASGRAFAADAVVCSVGGGGLMNGIMLGIERLLRGGSGAGAGAGGAGDGGGSRDVQILALETRGAESLAKGGRKARAGVIARRVVAGHVAGRHARGGAHAAQCPLPPRGHEGA
ncbi:L-serine dehydratase [Histoplasma capsulatum var. duboisii H88]|uniref:L-serine ammonia-lyase n=1 Tax=Ajellomyces capsulatus (strain H88) TaxID=544711 RepID=F0UIH5_AJEC8|nr:L-serine dehydratase [Histoplasma capsulatum var. duboisii H88]